MKFFKILKKIFTSILLGVVDSIPILPNLKNNLSSGNGNTSPGKLDIVRIFSSLVSVALIVAFIMGKLSMDELTKLLEFFK